jgi:hypothetical protein
MHFDVFNGDADGIAPHSASSESTLEATLVTGIKRDIQLWIKLA